MCGRIGNVCRITNVCRYVFELVTVVISFHWMP